ncbi:arsenite S-adenosylmethyltransferase [Coprinopsis marcescibilis]|uniref:Arsenite methyltransferase n=1 Tax=Coprinopsis marcescibilis TaxID=230819 RepID=A0A5C3LCS9_COPMA|nr:arsenite S-adenosylmethyltransferase [Coprinopsis marcescibilis]
MSCCSGQPCTNVMPTSDDGIVKAVTDTYGAHAKKAGNDPEYAKAVAAAFGYSAEELLSIPAESHMGLSCGNPTATASLKEGERVVDLGSGGGIDIFLAAPKVGPTGQAIGLDGSQDMIDLARRNAAKKNLKPPHVSFVLANLEKEFPIESNAIDCIISNCVINLLPDAGKRTVFNEIYRVLKPGGRVVIDDLVARKPLPEKLKQDLNAYISCISGSILEEEYKRNLLDSGFKDVLFVDKKSDLNAYWEGGKAGGCCAGDTSDSAPLVQKPDIASDINDWLGSYQIYAIKPKNEQGEVTIPPTALKRWWDAYPTVKSTPPSLTNDEVVDMIRNPGGEKDFVVIDVRRNDHAGGHVRGSEQWPAQTLYDDLPGLFNKHKDTKKVIFYCQSSNGRGPRSAGWYQDFLDGQGEEGSGSKAYVLQGGIKGWLEKFGGQEDLVDKD